MGGRREATRRGREGERNDQGEAEEGRETYLVEIVVLPNKLLELALHIQNLFARHLELDQRHPCLFEVLQESHLARLQEHQASPLSIRPASGAADSMNIISRIIGRIKLHDPVDSGNV